MLISPAYAQDIGGGFGGMESLLPLVLIFVVFYFLLIRPQQKRMKDHGFTIRPDIIIHIPFEQANYSARTEGNFVVIELKLRASEAQAVADYENLARMCEVLDYPLGIFVNIASNETYFESYEGEFKDRLHAFGVRLNNDQVVIVEQNSN